MEHGVGGEKRPFDVLQKVHVSSEGGGSGEGVSVIASGPSCKASAQKGGVSGGRSQGGSNPLVTRHTSRVTPEARDEDLRDGEFYAVRDVSFELRRGECLGLIGHNGAGKTTLLKMLNGLIKPDAGHITMRGRVGALIALGAGFNPILTGREPRPRMRGTEIDQPHVGPQGRASGVGESKYLHQWFGAGPFEKGTGAQMFYRLESLFFRILFAWEFKPVGG